jgi:hypothetical protein
MLLNATILRIDTPGIADTGGLAPFASGNACKIRCWLNSRQRQTKLDRANPATQEELVETKVQILAGTMRTQLKLAGYDVNLKIDTGMRLIIQSDADGSALLYKVRDVLARPKGSMGRVDVVVSQV